LRVHFHSHRFRNFRARRAVTEMRARERQTSDPFGGPPHARRETAKPLC